MKKTLLVTLDFYPNIGGVSHYWEQLGSQMSSSMWMVLAPGLRTGDTELSVPYRIDRASFIKKKSFPKWLPLLIHTWRVIKKEKSKTLIAAQVLPVGTVCFILHTLLHIPYIVSTHGMDILLPLKNPWKRFLVQLVLQGAQNIIANSTYTAYHLATYGIPEKKIKIIYPCPTPVSNNVGEPSEKVRIILSQCKGKKVLLTIARLVRRKGHEYVLKALVDVKKTMPDIQYLIVGEGPMRRELEERVSNLHVHENTLFTGLLSDNDMSHLMKRCDVFIMTPITIDGDVEGFGIVYLDAGVHGKPVIGSRSGGVGEAVIDGETGLLVDEKNSDHIRDAIIKIFSDESFAKKFGERGRERALRDFKIENEAEKLKTLLA
ncbi:MAG: glycosyltransferase family 4 protein [bacterium]|nr:glycosyltransferase family 4 protein [bacterium]